MGYLVVTHSETGAIKVLDSKDLAVVYTSDIHSQRITGMTFSVQGFFGVSSEDGSISLHDVRENRVIAKLDLGERISTIELHPDGLILGVGLSNGNIRIYDIRDMGLQSEVKGIQ